MSVTTLRKANTTSEQPTAVYGAYNTDGQIIYVGISNQPLSRWKQHECGKPWAGEVAEWRTLGWYPNRPSAKTQETFLIRQLCTRWNLDESPVETEVAARYLTLHGHIPGRDTRHRAPWPLRLLWWLTKALAWLIWTITAGTITLAWNLATQPLRPPRRRRNRRRNYNRRRR